MPAVIVDADGQAVSYTASVKDVAAELPTGLTSVTVAKLPEPGRTRWDPATRTVVALTPDEVAQLPAARQAAARALAADKGKSPAARIDALVELVELLIGPPA